MVEMSYTRTDRHYVLTLYRHIKIRRAMDHYTATPTFGRRAFAVAGPTFWNSLADELQTYSSVRFKLALKTFLFATY